MHRPNHRSFGPELWEDVQYTRPAIKARATLLQYTVALSLPFVGLVAVAGFLLGLAPHEIIGITCYHAMLTNLFMFDTLRNASHACFASACEAGFVIIAEGIPIVDRDCPYRHLAQLAFAIGGHAPGDER